MGRRLIELNDGMCAVVHMGKQNPKKTYTVGKEEGTKAELHNSKDERDLSVKVDNELAISEYIWAATAKADSVIGIFKNSSVCDDVDIWIKL